MSHPIIGLTDLVARRSDRAGFAGLVVTLYDLPECGAVNAEAGSDAYWFGYDHAKGSNNVAGPDRCGLRVLRSGTPNPAFPARFRQDTIGLSEIAEISKTLPETSYQGIDMVR